MTLQLCQVPRNSDAAMIHLLCQEKGTSNGASINPSKRDRLISNDPSVASGTKDRRRSNDPSIASSKRDRMEPYFDQTRLLVEIDPTTMFRRTQDGGTSLTLAIHFRSVDLEVMVFSSGHDGAVRVCLEKRLSSWPVKSLVCLSLSLTKYGCLWNSVYCSRRKK